MPALRQGYVGVTEGPLNKSWHGGYSTESIWVHLLGGGEKKKTTELIFQINLISDICKTWGGNLTEDQWRGLPLQLNDKVIDLAQGRMTQHNLDDLGHRRFDSITSIHSYIHLHQHTHTHTTSTLQTTISTTHWPTHTCTEMKSHTHKHM